MKRGKHQQEKEPPKKKEPKKRENKKKEQEPAQKIIHLKDFQEEPWAELSYEEEAEAEKEQLKKLKVPKAVYQVGVILLVAILGLAVWLNRGSLTPDNIVSWLKLQVMGAGIGDGFPVPITGGEVLSRNFVQSGGVAAILSDTSFTLLNSTGQTLVSLRHGFSSPILRGANGNYLLYHLNGSGYFLQNGADTLVEDTAPSDILAGAVSGNGRYALGMQGGGGASYFQVYLKNGTLQYEYQFSKGYLTALALNADGTYGAACTVYSEGGEMVSKVTVFYFDSPEPIAEYESRGNLLLDIYWSDNGKLFAVGDSAALVADSASLEFWEQNYEGRQLTAYCLMGNRAFLSVSAYEYSGSSIILVFDGEREATRIAADRRVEALSVAGGTVGALEGGELVLYDYTTGARQAKASAGADAKGIALLNERAAYILGVSEIRVLEVE